MRRFLSILALLVGSGFFAAGIGHASEYQDDTFAIAAEGEKVSAEIAFLSGPAPFFHLYDINGTPLKVFPNPHLDQEIGIGPAAAATLGDMGVSVLVGGMAGPKMMDVLNEKGVRFVPRKGKVRDVVKELQE